MGILANRPSGKNRKCVPDSAPGVQTAATQAPDVASSWHFQSDTLLQLGRVLHNNGRPAESEVAFRRALAVCEKIEAEGLTKGLLPAEALEHYEDSRSFTDRRGPAPRRDCRLPQATRTGPKERQNPQRTRLDYGHMPGFQVPRSFPRGRAGQESRRAAPKEGTFWNTLGVAHFRTGDWNAAIAALTRSMDLRTGGDSNDWFFLAMAHWQKGDKLEARCWYDKAVSWMDKNQSENDELSRFRAEAAALLEVKQKKD